MTQVKCIEKIRDKNNHIIGYTIIGNDKKTISVKPEKLKEAIRSGQLEVINLTLTSDNRLIDKKSDTPLKQINNTESLLNKLKSLGYAINTFDTDCGHKCYIASSPDNTKHIFIIPDDVKYVYGLQGDPYAIDRNKLHKYMSNIRGALKVIGGKNLISAQSMFYHCELQYIDLRAFNTSHIADMNGMFHMCKAKSLDLRSFNTSNVTDMSWMFKHCEAQSINLNSFDTSNVTNMYSMFHGCEVQSLDLRSFDTRNVADMSEMFSCCETQFLDLSPFNTSNVTDMRAMFFACKAQSIDLSSFDTSSVANMRRMFYDCKTQSLDLTSFNTSNVTDMYEMFYKCKSQIKVNDPKLKDQLQEDIGR